MDTKYKIEIDMHTHTLRSSTGYSTLLENIQKAKITGLSGIAITEYGPAYNNTNIKKELFALQKYIPESLNDILIINGVEANVMDMHTGKIDISEQDAEHFDWIVASYHQISDYDEKYINPAIVHKLINGLINNPIVMAIGHPERFNRGFLDIDALIRGCKEKGKVIEICNLFLENPEFSYNAEEILKRCKEYECPVCISSDAHVASQVGDFSNIIKILERVEFPNRLIINSSSNILLSYINKFKELKRVELQKKSQPRTVLPRSF